MELVVIKMVRRIIVFVTETPQVTLPRFEGRKLLLSRYVVVLNVT